MRIEFVDAENADLLSLTHKLDEYYFDIVGEVQQRYEKYNDPQSFACRAVAYIEGKAVGCGCWKALDAHTAEIKRIYVLPDYRRQGIASGLIRRLEQDVAEQGCSRVVLETARMTNDSESLYMGLGYHNIPYYGSPAGGENCLCFEKKLCDEPPKELRFVDETNKDLLTLAAEQNEVYHPLGDMACAVVVYVDRKAAGCGCWHAYDPVSAEIEQLHVREAYCWQDVIEMALQALEQHAAASGCHRAILRVAAGTSDRIAFYEKQGYEVTSDYENCARDAAVVCMEKEISDGTMR